VVLRNPIFHPSNDRPRIRVAAGLTTATAGLQPGPVVFAGGQGQVGCRLVVAAGV